MNLEFDTQRLNDLGERELQDLHAELVRLEKDAHKARAATWAELTSRRHVRVIQRLAKKWGLPLDGDAGTKDPGEGSTTDAL